VTAVMVPDDPTPTSTREGILEQFDMSLGAGLALPARCFGSDTWEASAISCWPVLSGVEMGLPRRRAAQGRRRQRR
jgi:hypothetical protein